MWSEEKFMTSLNETKSEKHLIMVVDDNLEFLSGVELTLEMEDFDVWTATNGKEALEALRVAFLKQNQEGENSRLPDLILADIMMPQMDGYDFYERVRAIPQLNHIPIIFLTAKGSDLDIRQGREMGIDDYLSKLCEPEDMLASIRGKLRRIRQQQEILERITRPYNHRKMPVEIVAEAAKNTSDKPSTNENNDSWLDNKMVIAVVVGIMVILVIVLIVSLSNGAS